MNHQKLFFTRPLDFYICVGTTFGMSLAIFEKDGSIKAEYNEYGNTYYDIVYDQKRGDYYFPSTSQSILYKVDGKTLESKPILKGYSITSLHLSNNFLYFAGYFIGNEDSTAIYEYDLEKSSVSNMLTPAQFINDVRGVVVLPEDIYFSETYKHRIIHFDRKNRTIKRIINGFSFPNKITLSCDQSYLFVADEHNDTIRKVKLKNFKEVWRLPFGIATSPSTLIELPKGKFKGYYLIADTDNNRVILIHPTNYSLIAEIRGLRSVMGIEAAFDQ